MKEQCELTAQLNADKEELKSAFKKFSEKYGANITGFTITRSQDSCWMLWDVVMDGRFFDTMELNGREPYPMGK